MPGRDWRDVIGVAGPGTPAPAPASPALPPQLQRLMQERQALEQRMSTLIGGADEDPRTAALYQVQPMADRIAAHRAWQSGRDSKTAAASAASANRRRADSDAATDRLDNRTAGTRADAPPLRPTAAERPRRRRRRLTESDEFLAAREAVGSVGRQFRDAQDRLSTDGDPASREALDRAMRDTGADKLMRGADKLDRLLDRAATTEAAPERAKRVIEDEWSKRRDQIGGADLSRYARGFEARNDRLLGVETGSVADMQERSERLREAALERRRNERVQEEATELRQRRARERREESQQQEAADDRRRQRARNRRQERAGER